jgi:CheY-like chemotaxis protein
MRRVLIVDDDRGAAASLQEFLQHKHCDSEIVDNGVDGLEALTSTPFDAAIVDLVMPNMDGIETLPALRKLRQFRGPGAECPRHGNQAWRDLLPAQTDPAPPAAGHPRCLHHDIADRGGERRNGWCRAHVINAAVASRAAAQVEPVIAKDNEPI